MIISTLAGAIIGIILGLIPGIHPNNTAPLIIALSTTTERITVFAASTAASFTVASHIPSILIGAPSGENLSVLPGHKLTKMGKGITAINLTLKGSLIAILFAPLITLTYSLFSANIYPTLSKLIPFFLILITVSMIKNKESALIVLLSALLGFKTLENATIMPMLTGLFGTSTLIIALTKKNRIEKQEIKPKSETDSLKVNRAATLSTILSSVLGIIPAISSALSATIGKKLGKMNEEEYLAFIGASNTTYVIASFLALTYIGKSRSGTTVALSTLKFPENPVLMITAIMTSTAITYIILRKNLSRIARTMNKINIKKATIMALVLLILLNIYLTNLKGLVILLTSTTIGITTVKLRVPRIDTMACLTIPTALLLL
ncbi:MAG: tripartite tricarboxylate transporter permease [archaeon]